jgi:hypothetical protein
MIWRKRINKDALFYSRPNWFLSGKSLTVVALLVLPFIFVITEVLTVHYLLTYSLKCPPLPYPAGLVFFNAVVLTDFQYFLYILILAFYPPYPLPFSRSIKRYFEIRGYKTAVEEYVLVKNILYVAVPLLIVTMVIMYVHDLDYKIVKTSTIRCPEWKSSGEFLKWAPQPVHWMTKVVDDNRDWFGYLRLFLFLIVVAGFLKMLFAVWRPSFRLYFAKGCFSFIEERKDEVERMKYFVLGLNSYNSYLRRQIKLEIGDLKGIYSQVASSPATVKDEVIKRVCKVFEKDTFEFEDYTLEPVRVISSFLKVSGTQTFLTQESLFNKLRNYAGFAIVAIPVLLSVLKAFKVIT